MRTPVRILAAAFAACTLVLGACGDDDATDGAPSGTTTSTATASAFPVTVEGANGAVTFDAAPERIVSLSPTATEMLFAIGAGDRVVAADEYSNYPPEAPTTDLSGYEPNVEAIVSYEPDLVVMQDAVIVDELAAVDVPLLVQLAATSLDDTYEQLEQLGAVTGRPGEAAEVAADLRAEVEEIVGALPERDAPLTYYWELDTTYYSLTSDTFVGELLRLAGLASIADAADDGTSYPQLSPEYIVEQDPDLILLADTKCCDQSPETVAARPGWGELTAVREDRVVPLDDDVASRWGPRVVDLLRDVTDALESVG
jgi:iron complex transport system substrate-binding protein